MLITEVHSGLLTHSSTFLAKRWNLISLPLMWTGPSGLLPMNGARQRETVIGQTSSHLTQRPRLMSPGISHSDPWTPCDMLRRDPPSVFFQNSIPHHNHESTGNPAGGICKAPARALLSVKVLEDREG
jgi:hypothetical protein